jgi:hypothetical protein
VLLDSPIEPPGALTVEAFARWASVDQTSVYEEIRSGRLAAVRFKDRLLIPYPSAERWLSGLPVVLPGDTK